MNDWIRELVLAPLFIAGVGAIGYLLKSRFDELRATREEDRAENREATERLAKKIDELQASRAKDRDELHAWRAGLDDAIDRRIERLVPKIVAEHANTDEIAEAIAKRMLSEIDRKKRNETRRI